MFCSCFFCLRYVTILTLVRVRAEHNGLYTVIISNEDDKKEILFDLEVLGVKMHLIRFLFYFYFLFSHE